MGTGYHPGSQEDEMNLLVDSAVIAISDRHEKDQVVTVRQKTRKMGRPETVETAVGLAMGILMQLS
jgi:hypothetical protein